MYTQLNKHCEITQESSQSFKSINRGTVLGIGFGLLPPELALQERNKNATH